MNMWSDHDMVKYLEDGGYLRWQNYCTENSDAVIMKWIICSPNAVHSHFLNTTISRFLVQQS